MINLNVYIGVAKTMKLWHWKSHWKFVSHWKNMEITPKKIFTKETTLIITLKYFHLLLKDTVITLKIFK